MSVRFKSIRKRTDDDDDEDEVNSKKDGTTGVPTSSSIDNIIDKSISSSTSLLSRHSRPKKAIGLSFNDEENEHDDNATSTTFKVKKSKLSRHFKEYDTNLSHILHDDNINSSNGNNKIESGEPRLIFPTLSSLNEESSSSRSYTADSIKELKMSQQFSIPVANKDDENMHVDHISSITAVATSTTTTTDNNNKKLLKKKSVSFNLENDHNVEDEISYNLKTNDSLTKGIQVKTNNSEAAGGAHDMVIISGDEAEKLDKITESEKQDTEDILYFSSSSFTNKSSSNVNLYGDKSSDDLHMQKEMQREKDKSSKLFQKLKQNNSSSSSSSSAEAAAAAEDRLFMSSNGRPSKSNAANINTNTNANYSMYPMHQQQQEEEEEDEAWEAEVASRAGIDIGTGTKSFRHHSSSKHNGDTNMNIKQSQVLLMNSSTTASVAVTGPMTASTGRHSATVPSLTTTSHGVDFKQIKKELNRAIDTLKESNNQLNQRIQTRHKEITSLSDTIEKLNQKIQTLQPVYNYLVEFKLLVAEVVGMWREKAAMEDKVKSTALELIQVHSQSLQHRRMHWQEDCLYEIITTACSGGSSGARSATTHASRTSDSADDMFILTSLHSYQPLTAGMLHHNLAHMSATATALSAVTPSAPQQQQQQQYYEDEFGRVTLPPHELDYEARMKRAEIIKNELNTFINATSAATTSGGGSSAINNNNDNDNNNNNDDDDGYGAVGLGLGCNRGLGSSSNSCSSNNNNSNSNSSSSSNSNNIKINHNNINTKPESSSASAIHKHSISAVKAYIKLWYTPSMLFTHDEISALQTSAEAIPRAAKLVLEDVRSELKELEYVLMQFDKFRKMLPGKYAMSYISISLPPIIACYSLVAILSKSFGLSSSTSLSLSASSALSVSSSLLLSLKEISLSVKNILDNDDGDDDVIKYEKNILSFPDLMSEYEWFRVVRRFCDDALTSFQPKNAIQGTAISTSKAISKSNDVSYYLSKSESDMSVISASASATASVDMKSAAAVECVGSESGNNDVSVVDTAAYGYATYDSPLDVSEAVRQERRVMCTVLECSAWQWMIESVTVGLDALCTRQCLELSQSLTHTNSTWQSYQNTNISDHLDEPLSTAATGMSTTAGMSSSTKSNHHNIAAVGGEGKASLLKAVTKAVAAQFIQCQRSLIFPSLTFTVATTATTTTVTASTTTDKLKSILSSNKKYLKAKSFLSNQCRVLHQLVKNWSYFRPFFELKDFIEFPWTLLRNDGKFMLKSYLLISTFHISSSASTATSTSTSISLVGDVCDQECIDNVVAVYSILEFIFDLLLKQPGLIASTKIITSSSSSSFSSSFLQPKADRNNVCAGAGAMSFSTIHGMLQKMDQIQVILKKYTDTATALSVSDIKVRNMPTREVLEVKVLLDHVLEVL